MKRFLLFSVVILVLSASGSPWADEPVYNGPPGPVTFQKYVIVAEVTINPHAMTPNAIQIPGDRAKVTFVHTYDPEFGLAVTSWKGHDLVATLPSGRINQCKYGGAANQLRVAGAFASQLQLYVMAGHSLSPEQERTYEFGKAVLRFLDDVGDIPLMSCSPRWTGK